MKSSRGSVVTEKNAEKKVVLLCGISQLFGHRSYKLRVAHATIQVTEILKKLGTRARSIEYCALQHPYVARESCHLQTLLDTTPFTIGE